MPLLTHLIAWSLGITPLVAAPRPTPPNPMLALLKPGKTLYRLDDRVNGTLQCTAWKLAPSKEDPNQGALSFSYTVKADKKAVTFRYQYRVLYTSRWLLRLDGDEKIEDYGGGVTYQQGVSCSESLVLGAVDKTSVSLDAGAWYLTKSACEKARKASSPASPGRC